MPILTQFTNGRPVQNPCTSPWLYQRPSFACRMWRNRHGLSASIEPGTSDVEDIVCPQGWEVVVSSAGNPKCQNEAGAQVDPVFRPSTKLAPIGIIGWAFVAASAMTLGWILLQPTKELR